MKSPHALLGILVFAFCAASVAGDVGVLVLIENPSGGTFRVREREMISSQGKVVLKQTPVVEHGPVSHFQQVYTVSGTDGYIIDLIAGSGRLEDLQVTVTDFVMKLAVQPRLIPGSDPPTATFRFNATELKGCCGQP